jgi:hypothetical protein
MKRLSARELHTRLKGRYLGSSDLDDTVDFLLLFGIVLFSLLILAYTVGATKSRAQRALEQRVSFDTQLNEARQKIQQYADDQVWLYSVTKQEGSFDTQLNGALLNIRGQDVHKR